MVLELVKISHSNGAAIYYVNQDGNIVPDSDRASMHEALEVFEEIKFKATGQKKTVLMREEI
jgi:hypothetical protein